MYDLFPKWRRLGDIRFLLLSQSFLCISVLVCYGSLLFVSNEQFIQTIETGLSWFSIWLQGVTLYNMSAIVFIIYLRQNCGCDYSTRKMLMGTMAVVYFVPLTPLIPLAFYLKGVVCADVANWKSPYKVECWWPQGNKDAIIATFFWILFLLYIVPAILSLVCITSLLFNRYKNKLHSRLAQFLVVVKSSQKCLNIVALCLSVAFLSVLIVISTVPESMTGFGVRVSLEKGNYFEFLRAVLRFARCVVLSACSAIPIVLGFLVEETVHNNEDEKSIPKGQLH